MTEGSAQKTEVRKFWERESCGADKAVSDKHTHEYYKEIEEYRYRTEPEIFSFAQFTRARGKDVLEVGVGAGTDFLQWARAGARAVGVDLTDEAVEHVTRRLELEGLNASVIRADCESLPFPDDTFDVVYSWGVIHHTPNTWNALGEIMRVCRPGGLVKVMVYNRHSPAAVMHWINYGLLRKKPWRSIGSAIASHLESPGTKAYTRAEVLEVLRERGVTDADVRAHVSTYDTDARGFKGSVKLLAARTLSRTLGWLNEGWFLTIEFKNPP